MSEELASEVEVINSIYGPDTVRPVSAGSSIYTLYLVHHDVTLRLLFPLEYPNASPQILGTENTGDNVRKGYGKLVLDKARATLSKVYSAGLVCIYDLLQELEVALPTEQQPAEEMILDNTEQQPSKAEFSPLPAFDIPIWTLSEPVTEKKSVFLARASTVTSPNQVHSFISHLIATDKRASKATHNISAYRIRPSSSSPGSQLVFQDCDDDGETAAGGRLLHLLQIMDVWGVLVVVSRWYGGVQLGPDRFRLINQVARDAVVAGGWLKARSGS